MVIIPDPAVFYGPLITIAVANGAGCHCCGGGGWMNSTTTCPVCAGSGQCPCSARH